MLNFDITKSLQPVEQLVTVTSSPRQRYLLLAFLRHLYLEMSGQYDDVLSDDMMVETPVYNLHALGFNTTITGKENVRSLYKFWADTNQTVFYGENVQAAVADGYIALTVQAHQQVWGGSILSSKVLGLLPKGLSSELLLKLLAAKGLEAKPDQMYLYSNFEESIWP